MSKTQENLNAAFGGESQANRKYLAFAEKAEKEGKIGIGKLFRVAAKGETVHALNHFKAMEGIKETSENLKSAIEGETYEIESMYPDFIKEAKEEGNTQALGSLEKAYAVEKIHRTFFQEALKKIESGEEIPDEPYYVCSVCGYPTTPEAPEKCPICGAPKAMFKLV